MNGSTVKDITTVKGITEDITKNIAERPADEPGAATPEQRFALLTARAGLEPELAQRYSAHPLSVLAEFGLPATWPVRFPDDRAADRTDNHPADHAGQPDTITMPGTIAREDLDRAGSSVTWGCFSNFTHLSAPGR
ncbi:hypothetical protein ACFXCZ_26060 [Streptomyces sp. NPDC059396]|uniref:hypothetical protein n=1 Tax=Streptomyces sp. NPDC059396 TaxID=3346819 RepID=UPI0036A29D2B